jgi:hypothetical protein
MALPVYILIPWGASNNVGDCFSPPNVVPAYLPIAAVRYRPVCGISGPQKVSGTALLALDVTTPDDGPPLYWGTEPQLGADLAGQGLDVAIFKTGRNNQAIASWLPGQPNWSVFFAANLPGFQANVAAAFPGREQKWFLLTNQGEFEAQAASSTGADNWAASLATLHAGIETLLQGADPTVTLEPPIVLRTNSHLAEAPHLAIVRAQQEIADPNYIDCDDVPLGPGDVHYTTPAALATIGSRQAAKVFQAAPPENTLPSQRLTIR